MIRKATRDDIPSIRAMARSVFPYTYGKILSPAQIDYMMEMMYSEKSLERQMTEEGTVFYISEGRGYVSYRPDSQTDNALPRYHLEKLYVLPEYQGKGLGRELFLTVVGDIRGRGAVLELNVNRSNPALSFYEHLGMKKSRQGDFPIGGGFYMNDFIMSIEVDGIPFPDRLRGE